VITDEHRERAHQILGYATTVGPHNYVTMEYVRVHTVAEALAAERERALAPVLALAKELARYPEVVPRDIARAIRRACGVQ
jgi:hypothetical protein